MNMMLGKRGVLLSALMSSMLLVTACGGSDDKKDSTPAPKSTTEILKGTAATGAPLAGAKLEVVNKTGQTKNTTVKDDGTFEITIDAGAPYMIKATKGDTVLYSYSAAAGYVNVTQLTTQALLAVNDNSNPESLYKEWVKSYSRVTSEKVNEAAAKVAANLNKALAADLTAQGIDAKKLNVFTQQFKVAEKGLDKILDEVKVDYSCAAVSCTVNYKVKNAAYTWDYSISTNGYNVVIDSNGNGPAGSGKNCLVDMDYKYSVNVPGYGTQTGTVAQKICYINFPENAACGAGNQNLKNLAQSAAGSSQGVGYSITINKFTANNVSSCPSGSMSIEYK